MTGLPVTSVTAAIAEAKLPEPSEASGARPLAVDYLGLFARDRSRAAPSPQEVSAQESGDFSLAVTTPDQFTNDVEGPAVVLPANDAAAAREVGTGADMLNSDAPSGAIDGAGIVASVPARGLAARMGRSGPADSPAEAG